MAPDTSEPEKHRRPRALSRGCAVVSALIALQLAACDGGVGVYVGRSEGTRVGTSGVVRGELVFLDRTQACVRIEGGRDCALITAESEIDQVQVGDPVTMRARRGRVVWVRLGQGGSSERVGALSSLSREEVCVQGSGCYPLSASAEVTPVQIGDRVVIRIKEGEVVEVARV